MRANLLPNLGFEDGDGKRRGGKRMSRSAIAGSRGEEDEDYEETSLHDNLMDIVMVRGAEHLALINIGMDRAIRYWGGVFMDIVEFCVEVQHDHSTR